MAAAVTRKRAPEMVIDAVVDRGWPSSVMRSAPPLRAWFTEQLSYGLASAASMAR